VWTIWRILPIELIQYSSFSFVVNSDLYSIYKSCSFPHILLTMDYYLIKTRNWYIKSRSRKKNHGSTTYINTVDPCHQGRSLWGAREALRPPCLWKFCFFWTPNRKKSTFSGFFSHSIYVKVDVTPPLLWIPSYAPACHMRKFESIFN
jgi:hypothetical protein